jgi:DNA-directed RNA polymerase specialized sigma24 family protein
MVAAGAGIGLSDHAPSVSIALVVIGAGMFFIGTMMPTLSEFQVGPTGFSAKLRERDQEFQAVFGPNADQLARIGTWLAGSPEAGKELVERALVETYMRWPQSQHTDPADAVRQRMVEMAPPAQPPPAPAAAQQQAGANDLLSRLIALPVAERSALVLHLLEGLSTETVASITHREPAAVATDIARGAAGVIAGAAPPPPGMAW